MEKSTTGSATVMTKGYIFDLKRFAIHDGPGIRTTVFMRGCPLGCWWCHNPESRQPLAMDNAATVTDGSSHRRCRTALADGLVSPEQVIDEVARDIPYYEQSGGGVTFSGGEPLMQLCRSRSIHSAVDTTGYAPTEDLERIIDLVDLFLYDLKIMDDRAHEEQVGVSNRFILDNLKMLARRGARVIIRVPLIPGITDTNANLDAIVQFVKPLPGIEEVGLLPYHRYFRHKVTDPELAAKLVGLQPKTEAEVSTLSRRLEARGLRVKIGG